MGKSISSAFRNEYTVSYYSMRGVDFSQGQGAAGRERFTYLENMYRDWDGGGGDVVESIPGFRRVLSGGGRTNGIFSHKDKDGREFISPI